MALRVVLVAALLMGVSGVRTEQRSSLRASAQAQAANRANPIRRVVNLLQKMSDQVKADGKKEEELFDKFLCYCTTGKGQLEESTSLAEDKVPKVQAAIEEAESRKSQLDADVKKAKADREEGKEAVAKAKALRAKEATAYAKLSSDLKTNLSALDKAISAISKGTAGAFLQTQGGAILRRLAVDADMESSDRSELTTFLSSSSDYAPKSGAINGILKQMQDTMVKELAEATATEEKAIKDFEALVKAKTAEIEALTQEIEAKLEASGELGVQIVNMKEDADDTIKALAEDKNFLQQLNEGCDSKKAEWEERCKTRTDELLAIADTIKLLNDDDALELFKKTLPAPEMFLQVQVSAKQVQASALSALSKTNSKDPRVALLAVALGGGSKSFDKVIKMIDEMVELLGKEQVADDEKKEYCEGAIDKAEDEVKVLENEGNDLQKAIDNTKELISTLGEEIAALLKGIKDLDGQVADATAERKEQAALYKQTMQEDTAAKEILKMAKNRLAKFYAPKMYQPPAKGERSEMGRISEEMSFGQQKVSPGPPPETFDAYSKKNEEHGGVVAMMDLLISDLDKEMTELKTQEKADQASYEKFIAEAAEKRADDSKSAEQKTSEKAENEASLVNLEQKFKDNTKETYLKDTELKDLHGECDWLVANYEVRKEARAGEVDAIKKAKAVLSGADYSLMQTHEKHAVLRTPMA